MIEEDLFEQESQKKKRLVLVLLVCLFVVAGGGFVARRASLVEETIEGKTATAVLVADVASQPTLTETPTPPREESVSKQAVEGTATTTATASATVTDEVGGSIGADQEPPAATATEETATKAVLTEAVSPEGNGGTITPGEAVAGDVDTGAGDDGGVDKSGVEDEASGEIDADTDSGEAETIIDEESTTFQKSTPDSEINMDDIDAEDSQTSDEFDEDTDSEARMSDSVVTDEVTNEVDSEDQTVEQDTDQEQEADFEPPPGQLPVTGTTILSWGVAPVVAMSVVILLVSAGVSSLLWPKHQRY